MTYTSLKAGHSQSLGDVVGAKCVFLQFIDHPERSKISEYTVYKINKYSTCDGLDQDH